MIPFDVFCRTNDQTMVAEVKKTKHAICLVILKVILSRFRNQAYSKQDSKYM